MIDWRDESARVSAFALALWLVASAFLIANTWPVRLTIEVFTDAPDTAQLFYSSNGTWNERESATAALIKGWNRIEFTLPQPPGPTVRFDPGQRATAYRLLRATWSSGGFERIVQFADVSNPRSGTPPFAIRNGELLIQSGDNDAQAILPAPDLSWRVLRLGMPIGLPLLGLGALVFVLRRRRPSALSLAMVFISVSAAAYALLYLLCEPKIPLADDWRYVVPGPFNLVDGGMQWLTVAGNDTYFLTGQIFDYIVLHLSGVDFGWLRAFALALLLLHLFAQNRVLVRAAAERSVAAVAVALQIWSLASNGYWGATAMAYHQFLPTLAGSLILLHIVGRNGELHTRYSPALLIVLCLGSGLAYISGGPLLSALGLACWLTSLDRGRTSMELRRISGILLTLGSALLVFQLVAVAQRQGSLLEHNHAVASIYPTDRRFWFYFLALYGRALGYSGPSTFVDALLTIVALFPAIVLGLQQLRSGLFREPSRQPPLTTLLAIYAGLGSVMYAAMVAFGRAGFISPTAGTAEIVAVCKGRFHYWPIAAMLPYLWLGWAAVVQRLAFGSSVLSGAVAALLLLPKSPLPMAHLVFLRSQENLAVNGMRCLHEQLADTTARGQVICTQLTVAPLDLRPVVAKHRTLDSALYRELIGGTRQVASDGIFANSLDACAADASGCAP